MNALQEARTAVERLTVPERQQLIEYAKASVEVAPGIFRTPGVCGGDACVGASRLAVWMLEESRRAGMSDQQLHEAYPALTQEELAAAWQYVSDHPEEIEQAIAENEQV